jgi:agmatinase
MEWKEINDRLCLRGIEYIQFLEEGGRLEENVDFQETVKEITTAQLALAEQLEERAIHLLNKGKIVAVLGGEHSTPFGLINAIDKLNKPFGILQIDAHADLRNAYEGFDQSHASIMFNAIESCKNLIKLVQVGIRDIAESEVELIHSSNGLIETFFDWDLKAQHYQGVNWHDQVTQIIATLPENVYISFDIDGLTPSLCPNTGTPVVGGLELEQVNYLIFELVKSGKKIVGFDLNEVAPGTTDDWDANVGARALWNLVCATEYSRRITK